MTRTGEPDVAETDVSPKKIQRKPHRYFTKSGRKSPEVRPTILVVISYMPRVDFAKEAALLHSRLSRGHASLASKSCRQSSRSPY